RTQENPGTHSRTPGSPDRAQAAVRRLGSGRRPCCASGRAAAFWLRLTGVVIPRSVAEEVHWRGVGNGGPRLAGGAPRPVSSPRLVAAVPCFRRFHQI